MPELPEVAALSGFLGTRLRGRRIERLTLASFAALKTYDPPLEALHGREITGTARRGKFLAVEAAPLHLVLHLARAGWVRWRDDLDSATTPRLQRGPLVLRCRLDTGAGFDVTEQGTEKRLAVYVVRRLEDVPGIAALGPDPLDPPLDAATLADLLGARREQLKTALVDQEVIAGIGNAYSDEILNVARLSPFRMAASLRPDEVQRLAAAIASVLADAVTRSADLPAQDLKAEKRSGMRVHGRTGLPCPECGDTVREVSLASRSFQYCPTCQTGGRPLADRRLSRLLR